MLVALIAVHAVIDIPTYVRVMEIGRVAASMASCALKNGVVTRIGVAGRAHSIGAAVAHGPPSVIERSSRPSRGGVAGCTSRREHRRRGRMDRTVRRQVIRFMAAVTVSWQRRVVVVHMTIGAGHLRVESGQRKRCCVVVERAVRPQSGVVAYLAGCREAHPNVVYRCGRGVVVVQMARNTGGICARQIVVVIDVTVGAHARRDGM